MLPGVVFYTSRDRVVSVQKSSPRPLRSEGLLAEYNSITVPAKAGPF